MEIYQQLADATQEVFQSMLAMEIAPQAEIGTPPESFSETVSGMVGMGGLYKGIVAVHAPYPLAKKITSQFLMTDVDEINDDVLDAFGELANMLAGSIKAMLSSSGKDIQLSVPSSVSGEKYTLDINRSQGTHLIVPFETEAGQLLIQLHFEKQNGG
ncbi:MAG: chemotaxis protein CheX [Deltaproteobacteria bacterium]|nr:chemotaxis protein CheX [Deltaproteobacteria bacterium]